MQQTVILLIINSPSTCFGRLYAHRQEVRLRFSLPMVFLSCCDCCDVVCTVWSRLPDSIKDALSFEYKVFKSNIDCATLPSCRRTLYLLEHPVQRRLYETATAH